MCNAGRYIMDIVPLSDKTCIEGEMHLVGSDDLPRGRVEYCYNGTWYSLCADGWDTVWNETEVVCTSMGFTTYFGGSQLCFIKGVL